MKTTLYKVTDATGWSGIQNPDYQPLSWGPGVTRTAKGRGGRIGTSSRIHAYPTPFIAALFSPLHFGSKGTRMWCASGRVLDHGQRGIIVGCRTLTTEYETEFPVIPEAACIRMAITLAARTITSTPPSRPIIMWSEWASDWIRNRDRGRIRAGAVAKDMLDYVFADDKFVNLRVLRLAATAACAVSGSHSVRVQSAIAIYGALDSLGDIAPDPDTAADIDAAIKRAVEAETGSPVLDKVRGSI